MMQQESCVHRLNRASRCRRAPVYALGALATVLALPALADGQQGPMGWDDLFARLGGDTPTGAGVIGGQIEAPNGSGDWAPDPNNSNFSDVTFVYESGNPTGFSGHASTVGRHFYGNSFSMAPDVNEVHCWEVNNWLSSFLRLGQTNQPPNPTVADVCNNSWIGTAGGFDNEILRRQDFAINAQNLLVCVGVNNGSGWGNSNILLSHGYNSISVGVSDGDHNSGLTLAGIDGPGRMKPEIVAPDSTTSWATGLISSVCSMLLETSRTWDGLASNPNAQEPEVIKAALLAGATHRPGWTNNPNESGPMRGITETPLDPVYGVDQANVNTSHMILTGLEQDGSSAPGPISPVTNTGWDFDTLSVTDIRYYRFDIATPKDEVSVLMTWNRHMTTSQFTGTAPGVANFDMELLDNNFFQLHGANESVFGGGNIASYSDVDNIEHLYITDLAPGTYYVKVERLANGLGGQVDYAIAWHMDPDQGTPATLDSFDITFGSVVSGDLSDLLASDDSYLQLQSQFGFQAQQPYLDEVQLNFTAAHATPSSVAASVEARINNPGGTCQVRAKNYPNNGIFQLIHTYSIGTTEEVESIPNLTAEHVNPSNSRVRLQVRHFAITTFSATGFLSFIDHAHLETFE